MRDGGGVTQGKTEAPSVTQPNGFGIDPDGKTGLGHYAKGKPKRNVEAQVADQTEMFRDGEQMGK